MDLFDIVGPIMVGPSSSHTAGAVRMGYVAGKLLGEPIQKAEILLYGSFLATGEGHGTRKAIVAGLMECFPQVLYNVTIQPRKKGLWQDDADIAAVIEKHTAILGDNGRILVRESGTEPLIRVMVEGKNAGQIEAAAQEITEQVKIFAAS